MKTCSCSLGNEAKNCSNSKAIWSLQSWPTVPQNVAYRSIFTSASTFFLLYFTHGRSFPRINLCSLIPCLIYLIDWLYVFSVPCRLTFMIHWNQVTTTELGATRMETRIRFKLGKIFVEPSPHVETEWVFIFSYPTQTRPTMAPRLFPSLVSIQSMTSTTHLVMEYGRLMKR